MVLRMVAAEGETSLVEGRNREIVSRLAEEFLVRCRGEGPPNCTARCPLGVDIRAFIQLLRQGRYRDSLQLIREKLPFPGIMGYLCTHPCELHCKRIDRDSAVRVRELRRFLAAWEPGEPRHLLACEPDRGEAVAVVGAGPGGLLAAHDLRRRGYRVTVFERSGEIGGCLVQKISRERMPREVVDRDLSIIDALSIRTMTGHSLGREVGLRELRESFGAVLLFLGFDGGTALLASHPGGLKRTVRGTVRTDPLTLETSLPGVFAGGDAVTGPRTVIDALAQGRRAADSAHRFLAGRDLKEGRSGPVPSPLLWTLDVDSRELRLRQRLPLLLEPPDPILSEEEARQEAERCLDCECRICVDECEFLSQHCQSPKEIARRAEGGWGEKMQMSCNLCSLCGVLCPENLDVAPMLGAARRHAAGRGDVPRPEHRSWLAAQRSRTLFGSSLLFPPPGRSRCRALFFPGCDLPETSPRGFLAAYDAVRGLLPGTGILLECCGSPLAQMGLEEDARAQARGIEARALEQGAQEIIAVCPECTRALRRVATKIRVTTLWELLAGSRLMSSDQISDRRSVEIALHDPCRARDDPEIRGAVRELLGVSGASLAELDKSGERTRCCGFGGLAEPVDPELSKKVARRLAAESPLPMVTYCSRCRSALARVGKEAVHLVDFLFTDDWKRRARARAPGGVWRSMGRMRVHRALTRLKPPASE